MAVDPEYLVKAVRAYRGVSRKAPIESVAKRLLPAEKGDIIAAAGEDAAAISRGSEILLFAADGIIQDLIAKNPRWAGYCSILVNANDIAAMGGIPIAAVNVLSCGNPGTRSKIVQGMREASDKLGIPIVGGHLHPDTDYSSVDVAMIGTTERSRLVLSSTASAGDSVIFAMDTDGRFTRGLPYSWDTTSMKSEDEVRRRLNVMHEVAPSVSAGKDISNPGSLGTLGMLLEASSKGAVVDVDTIPGPRKVDRIQWLLAYQGCGFVVTCPQDSSAGVIRKFESAGLSAAECGHVSTGSKLTITGSGGAAVLFDFKTHTLGCRATQKI